jgi:hypothetical protein
VLIVLVSLRAGFAVATVTSIFAAVCLDYFFIPPVLSFEVNTVDYWIALGTFEFTALVITRLAYVANLRAVEAIAVRRDTERLYETARRILLFDRSEEPGSLLVALIQDVFKLAEVVLLDAVTAKTYAVGNPTGADERLRGAYSLDRDEFDTAIGTWFWVLRLGARPVGGVALDGTAMAAPVGVSAEFNRRRVQTLASQGSIDTCVELCLCRDRDAALCQALEPEALVVIGLRRSWWPTAEKALIRKLRRKGHNVILVDSGFTGIPTARIFARRSHG